MRATSPLGVARAPLSRPRSLTSPIPPSPFIGPPNIYDIDFALLFSGIALQFGSYVFDSENFTINHGRNTDYKLWLGTVGSCIRRMDVVLTETVWLRIYGNWHGAQPASLSEEERLAIAPLFEQNTSQGTSTGRCRRRAIAGLSQRCEISRYHLYHGQSGVSVHRHRPVLRTVSRFRMIRFSIHLLTKP